MFGVPQSNMMNPAFQPANNVYIGCPGLSPLEFSFYNNVFSVAEIYQYNDSLDRLITPFHPKAKKEDKDGFYKILKEINYISFRANIPVASFGFRVGGNMYASINASQRVITSIDYPKDFITIVTKGFYSPGKYDLSGFGANISVFQEVGLGLSYKYSEELLLGVRPKLLFGNYNYNIANDGFYFEVDTGYINFNSSVNVRMNSPFTQLYVNEDGKLDSMNTELDTDIALEDIKNPSNLGLGIDIGFQYKPISKLWVSGSIVDLGFIQWQSYSKQINYNGTAKIQGLYRIEPGKSNQSDDADTAGFLSMLLDTLQDKIGSTV